MSMAEVQPPVRVERVLLTLTLPGTVATLSEAHELGQRIKESVEHNLKRGRNSRVIHVTVRASVTVEEGT